MIVYHTQMRLIVNGVGVQIGFASELYHSIQVIGVLWSQVPWPFLDLRHILYGFGLVQQAIQVKPPSEHRQLAMRRPGPRFLRTIPIQLHAPFSSGSRKYSASLTP